MLWYLSLGSGIIAFETIFEITRGISADNSCKVGGGPILKLQKELQKNYKRIAKELQKNYKRITKELQKNYKRITKKLQKNYKKITKKLQKNYKRITKELQRITNQKQSIFNWGK
jgi:predicted component of viral defense system (DUF524 family)